MTTEYINKAPHAPQAIGPYSQAVRSGDLYFLSGQIPIDPATGKLTSGIEAQTEQVLLNLRSVLAYMGLDFRNVVKSTIYLISLEDFGKVNEVYAKALGDCRPARATVQVAALPLGARIEIEMVAVKS